jgi:hypothetical protein
MELMRMGILLVVGGVVAFFLFQIGIVLYRRMNETNELREQLVGAPYVPPSQPAPVAYPEQKGTPMPSIPGQTDEEVRTPEPIQRRVHRQTAEEPEPVESTALQQEEAGFTENLRHPEASFQPHPFNNKSVPVLAEDGRIGPLRGTVPVDSGVASKVSSPGFGGDQQAFESDMAQNGGEWLKGTFAFDSREPSGFSSLF